MSEETELEAQEIAQMIHDDFTLQIGESISHDYDVEWLACMEAHIAAALRSRDDALADAQREIERLQSVLEEAYKREDRYRLRADHAEAQVAALNKVLQWTNGESPQGMPDFPERQPMEGRYYWRILMGRLWQEALTIPPAPQEPTP